MLSRCDYLNVGSGGGEYVYVHGCEFVSILLFLEYLVFSSYFILF